MKTLTYEDFESAPPAGSEDPAPSADYLRGYEAGLLQAAAEQAEEAARLKDGVVTALQDLDFTRAEALLHVLRPLRGLLSAMVEILLPASGADDHGARLLDRLMPLCEDLADVPVELRASPETATALLAAAGSAAPGGVSIVADPALLPEQVILCREGSETLFDQAALRDRLAELLGALPTRPEDYAHGT